MAKQKMVKIQTAIGQIYDGKLLKEGEPISVDEKEAERLLKKRGFFSPVKTVAAKPQTQQPEQGVE